VNYSSDERSAHKRAADVQIKQPLSRVAGKKGTTNQYHRPLFLSWQVIVMPRTFSHFFLLLAAASLAAVSVKAQEEPYCYSEDSRPFSLFSTKTSYFEVDNEEAKPLEFPGELFTE
jgi:hypothetical protein